MNLYDFIKKDHTQFSMLFQEYQSATDLTEKRSIITTIAQELLVHLEAERDAFYKVLRSHSAALELIEQGASEHKKIESHIITILSRLKYDFEWKTDVVLLRKAVNYHIDEVEGKIHVVAQTLLTDDMAKEVQANMQQLKKEYRARIEEILSF